MRVEIDGKVYDTEKAKCRFYYDGTLDFIEDFLYAAETLYETEEGGVFPVLRVRAQMGAF